MANYCSTKLDRTPGLVQELTDLGEDRASEFPSNPSFSAKSPDWEFILRLFRYL